MVRDTFFAMEILIRGKNITFEALISVMIMATKLIMPIAIITIAIYGLWLSVLLTTKLTDSRHCFVHVPPYTWLEY